MKSAHYKGLHYLLESKTDDINRKNTSYTANSNVNCYRLQQLHIIQLLLYKF